ncbi:2-oxo acid dehydrogenase subunit E2 [Nocardioides panacisoli]|uniref:dihydrolipoamide acetyltransferase family protein n=1 Tax=Nocardioides panacisoli TaxID=627624 RepID=UPI001C634A9D|nr:dihydrolipoamide acetyltransferase family protein [Nocardioides panacisoli]QYJ02966.1 2-oxo acid dehydrogenase subunit E2 [Nocardioides panacisoli]
MAEYKLPDVGEGLTEAEIVTWRVAVGDTVAVNDIIVEIETAKSIVELPSPYAGEITALLVEEGETIPVGTPIIDIGEPGAAAAAPAEPAPEQAAEPAAEAEQGSGAEDVPVPETTETPQPPAASEPIDTNVPPEGNPTLVGYGPKETSLKRRARVSPGGEEAAGSSGNGVLAKPPVRKLAQDLGVDLADVAPTGDGGVVTREDVEQAAGGGGAAGAPAAGSHRAASPVVSGEEVREPIKGVRKHMAAAMVSSAFTAPHVTEWVTVDATPTVELVRRLQQHRDFRDLKLSPMLVVARAVTLAMRRTPIINSFWDSDAQEVVIKPTVNLGIAAATPRGLVVPNIKGADQLGLRDLAAEINQLTATAREGRTQPAAQAGGSFSITNVGVFGVDAGTPIINPGESAILCLGAIRREPWVVTDETGAERVEPRDVVTLALSFDHRHIDGAAGSTFLADVAGMVSDPGTAMMF